MGPESDHQKALGYLEKPVSLVFRGTLRGLSIEGRVINQRLTLQLIMSLPPNPHPVEVFRCAHWGIMFRCGDETGSGDPSAAGKFPYHVAHGAKNRRWRYEIVGRVSSEQTKS